MTSSEGVDLVIGGGPAGLYVAKALVDHGRHPIVVEKQRKVGGNAVRSAGQLPPDLLGPLAPVAWAVFELWQERSGLQNPFTRGDTLHLQIEGGPNTTYTGIWERAGRDNQEVFELSPQEAATQWSGILDHKKIKRAALDTRDFRLNPARFLAEIEEQIGRGGGILTETQVTSIRQVKSIQPKCVATLDNRAEISCDNVIDTTGPWANRTSYMAGKQLPLVTEAYGGSFTASLPSDIFLPEDAPMVVWDGKKSGYYAQPLAYNRVYGAPGSDERTDSRRMHNRDLWDLIESFHDFTSDIQLSNFEDKICMRPLGPGGSFVIGQFPGTPAMWTLRGLGHFGVCAGVVGAEDIACQISRHERPRRFAEALAACPIKLETYSPKNLGVSAGWNLSPLRDRNRRKTQYWRDIPEETLRTWTRKI